MQNDLIQTVTINEMVVRFRAPVGTGPHPLFLMLHGWTGDENAMWVFASRLPMNAWLVTPRGLFTTPLGGYSWHPYKSRVWPWVDDFKLAMDGLSNLLNPTLFPTADLTQIRIVGFSQGAALGFSFALLHPEKVYSLAGLSGFLPDGASALVWDEPLKDRHIYMAHGKQDELVPVERARQTVELLRQAGAIVSYCEDDVGHKLSADCFRGMQAFFERY